METFIEQHPIIYSISLTLLGSIIGGLISYFIARWQMRKQVQENNIKILHDVQGPIDIGSGLTSLFPDVQLYYKKEKIDFKIQYITGTIKNTDEKRTVKTSDLPFELKLPKNCEVLEAKILEAPKEEIQPKNKGNIVEISTPKTFLPQEQINYCILYKSPDKVESEIILKTRMADVDIIKTEKEAVNKEETINPSILAKIAVITSIIGVMITVMIYIRDIIQNNDILMNIEVIVVSMLSFYVVYVVLKPLKK